MAEEEHISQFDQSVAIVLGELILIKLLESCRQPLFHLVRQRYAPVLPVHRNELGEFVGALDDACECLRNRPTVRLVSGHLADEQKRRAFTLPL